MYKRQYGNIENKDINLEEGINIIHGANESGKSTLLNYIISIFYGISKNKDGKALSDYEKYKPWNSNEFSGRISYKLENGEEYEIFRDFNKKNPKIYNDKLEDISDRFETDKKDGSKFFIEQMGIDKQMYLSTVVSTQEEVRLDEKNQNMLIQKIANLAGTGEDNVSYKKALIKLQEKIRDEIGTNKTSQKPINIIEKEIVEINNKIVETEKYRNRKYEIDAEKEQILSELKELEQQKQILQELQNSMKSEEETKNRLEIREKNRKDNITKINELTNQKNTINAESERVQSAKNHLQDIIKGHKENIEKLNSEIEKIANELKLKKYGGYIISYNGARIINCASREEMYASNITVSQIHKLYDMSKKAGAYIQTYVGNHIIASEANEYTDIEKQITGMDIIVATNFKEYISDDVVKAIVLQHPDKLKKIEETWKNEIGDSMYMTISKPFFLEFMNKEVDKSKSIERLAKILGISMLEVIAIGDSYNDLSMIKAAGLGVAMDNAVDCVKAAANYTTDDNEHDGVAKVVEKFILGKNHKVA